MQRLYSSEIKFLGAQDGIAERKLKSRLAELFSAGDSVIRAYLVRIDYGSAPEFNVALCLRTEVEEPSDLNDAINAVFANMFRADEHLDVLFLTEEREETLSKVCAPFFERSRCQCDNR